MRFTEPIEFKCIYDVINKKQGMSAVAGFKYPWHWGYALNYHQPLWSDALASYGLSTNINRNQITCVFPVKFPNRQVRFKHESGRWAMFTKNLQGNHTCQMPMNMQIFSGWSVLGKYHRLDGPACVSEAGAAWSQRDLFHRCDGPVNSGASHWCINSKGCTRAEGRWNAIASFVPTGQLPCLSSSSSLSGSERPAGGAGGDSDG